MYGEEISIGLFILVPFPTTCSSPWEPFLLFHLVNDWGDWEDSLIPFPFSIISFTCCPPFRKYIDTIFSRVITLIWKFFKFGFEIWQAGNVYSPNTLMFFLSNWREYNDIAWFIEFMLKGSSLGLDRTLRLVNIIHVKLISKPTVTGRVDWHKSHC